MGKIQKPDGDQRLSNLIRESASVSGGAVAALLGLAGTGDPWLAAVLGGGGALAGSGLRRIGEEIAGRVLPGRERARVVDVVAIVAEEIDSRIAQGEPVRYDGFFEIQADGRCDASEVAEQVLLKCQREPEARKISHMAHLLASLVFRADVSALMAHQLIKHAEQLTYRQFCILSITSHHMPHLTLRAKDYRDQKGFDMELLQVLYEIHDLYNRSFVNFGGEVAFGPSDVNPGAMVTQGLGVYLAQLCRVHLIPESDISPILAQLQ